VLLQKSCSLCAAWFAVLRCKLRSAGLDLGGAADLQLQLPGIHHRDSRPPLPPPVCVRPLSLLWQLLVIGAHACLRKRSYRPVPPPAHDGTIADAFTPAVFCDAGHERRTCMRCSALRHCILVTTFSGHLPSPSCSRSCTNCVLTSTAQTVAEGLTTQRVAERSVVGEESSVTKAMPRDDQYLDRNYCYTVVYIIL